MQKGGWVYMMSSVNKRVLYIGVTANIEGRAWEHRTKYDPKCFTARFNCINLVYYNYFDNIEDAIEEEKRLKGYGRDYKEKLVNTMNPEWKDLANNIMY